MADSIKFEGVVEGFDHDHDYKDCRFGPPFFKEVVEKCESFNFETNDVIVSAFPKTGNTWIQEIVWLIENNADVEAASKSTLMERFPLMELKYGEAPAFVDILENKPSPRLINTHLPYKFIGPSLEKAKPKVIVVFRNPKDQMVSWFHFYNSYPGRKVEKFSDFYNMYINGKLTYGYYIDHAIPWWEQRDKENYCIVKYEDVKADHYGSVELLAKFLEKDLSPEQIQAIVDATSISSMRNRGVSKGGKAEKGGKLKDDKFFRKGIVGDWETLFTKEQSDYITKECQEKLEPKGLVFRFK